MIQSLVIIEHDGGRVKRGSLAAIALARQLDGPYSLLVLGHGLAGVAASLQTFGAASVLVADDPALSEPLADRYAAVIARVATRLSPIYLLGATSTFTKDILPRAAALLDAAMLTDVTAVELKDGDAFFQRPICAGAFFATVKLEGSPRVLTARGTAFAIPQPNCQTSPIEAVQVESAGLPSGMGFISREQRTSTRPDLTEARVVVSGGRPLKDKETFDQLIGALADALGGAVGATRAAVDAGLAPNDCQVGQTGKTVAPELYIAVGVSGAVQHLAGIKDSRIIVAINRDPDAPVFQIATYGVVGDLYQIVPQLIESLRKP